MACKRIERPSIAELDKRRQLSIRQLPVSVVKRFGVVSLCQVARVLGCSRPTVYKLCRCGELRLVTEDGQLDGKAVKVCGLTCITLDSWNAYRSRNGII